MTCLERGKGGIGRRGDEKRGVKGKRKELEREQKGRKRKLLSLIRTLIYPHLYGITVWLAASPQSMASILKCLSGTFHPRPLPWELPQPRLHLQKSPPQGGSRPLSQAI